MRLLSLSICMALVVLSCADSFKEKDLPVKDHDLFDELQILQGRRIYFGHQSVGENILQGVQDILSEYPRVRLNVVQLTDTTALPAAFLAESAIGANEFPERKCKDFVRTVDSTFAGRLDIALMKFCFADVIKTTDVDAIFGYYRKAVEDLRKAYPRLKLIHVTVPLTSGTAGWKRMVNAVLGRTGNNDLGNVQRARFNEMLMRQYAGDPVFDLACLESTYPDGRRKTFQYDGRSYFELVPDYADADGSHLNEVGRRVAARALLKTLAAVAANGR